MSKNTQIIIVGGGLVGLTCSLLLARFGIRSDVIDRMQPSAMKAEEFDGRVSAISFGSQQIFENLGLWDALVKDAGPIHEIRIADDHSPLFLHYDKDLSGGEPMGHMIENRVLRRVLLEAAEKHPLIEIHAPATYTSILQKSGWVEVALAGGKKLKGKILVAADGKHSNIRKLFGFKTTSSDYQQTAIVCSVRHAEHHQNIAIEHFFPTGPFAILPMGRPHNSREPSGYHSAIVWTESRERAEYFLKSSDGDFMAELSTRFGDYLGKLTLVGNRYSYPLSLTYSDSYVKDRVVLLGDSAHAIHPIAGQGLNLCFRDVALLAELIDEANGLGLDLGNSHLLETFEDKRKIDNMVMIHSTDTLNRLFSNSIPPVQTFRRLGLGMVNRIPFLKKKLVEHAMGVGAFTPALIQKKDSKKRSG